MARGNFPLYALNGGEVSKNVLGRVDMAKMRLAAQCQVNWLPWVVGTAMLRPGLQFVTEILDDSPAVLVDFVFSKLDTALLELTAYQMRVIIDDEVVTRPSVGTTVLDPNFTGSPSGAWVTTGTTSGASAVLSGVLGLVCPPVGGLAQAQQAISVAPADEGTEHGLRIVVGNGPVTIRAGSGMGASDLIPQTILDTGTHALACTPGGSSINLQIESTDAWGKTVSSVTIDAAGPLILPTNWASADLANVRWAQSGDIIYVACYGQQQQMVQRRSLHGWSVCVYRSSDGPFQAAPGITANLAPGAYFGNTSLIADRPWFQAGHVGCLFRLFTTGQNNFAILGAANAYTPAVRIDGVGTTRDYGFEVSSTGYVGVLTFQRSFDGPDSGFVDVAAQISGFTGTIVSATGGSAGTPDLDNVICWERVGFHSGDYSSGTVSVISTYGGGGTYGICRATSIIGQEELGIEILQPFSSEEATTDWVEADWSGVVGWPTSVCFHEGRLTWLGRDQQWLSVTNNYYSFDEIDDQGNPIGDSGPINIAMGDGPVDTISWGLSLTRLLAGREQSIVSTRSSNFDQPVTPTSVVVRTCSDQGAERLPAVKAGKRGIFVQQSGRKVYELAFNPQEFDYQDRDLTRLNLDIGKPGFVSIAMQTQPDKMLWLPRGDGQAAALLYDYQDEIEAWWRLQTLGVIESVRVLPSSGIEDSVYFVVQRVINGVTRRFLELLALRDDCVGGTLNYQLDCAVSYSGTPVSTLQASWLPNTTVTVWADGANIGTATTDGSGTFTLPDGKSHYNVVAGLTGSVIVGSTNNPLSDNVAPAQVFAGPQSFLTVGTQYNGYPCEVFADIGGTGRPLQHIGSLVVSGGFVILPNNQFASTIVACLGYVAPFQSAKLAYAATGPTALAQKKKIDQLGLVLYDTAAQALQVGQSFDNLDPLPLVESDQATAAGTVWSEYDGPMQEIPGQWDTDARLCLLAQAPNPCTIGGVVVAIQTSEWGRSEDERAP